jgi:hypothetical protein
VWAELDGGTTGRGDKLPAAAAACMAVRVSGDGDHTLSARSVEVQLLRNVVRQLLCVQAISGCLAFGNGDARYVVRAGWLRATGGVPGGAG